MTVARRHSLISLPHGSALNGLASIDLQTDPLPFHLAPCLCFGKGVCCLGLAFLSTAAPRRGTVPDLEQQPSPKFSSSALSPGVSPCRIR